MKLKNVLFYGSRFNPHAIIQDILMWAHLESNQAPTDYESVALTE